MGWNWYIETPDSRAARRRADASGSTATPGPEESGPEGSGEDPERPRTERLRPGLAPAGGPRPAARSSARPAPRFLRGGPR